MLGNEDWILDQTGQSCFPHGVVSYGAYLWCHSHGMTPPKFSPYHTYAFARRRAAGAWSRVADTGTSPLAGLAAVHQHGACSYSRWNPSVHGFGDGWGYYHSFLVRRFGLFNTELLGVPMILEMLAISSVKFRASYARNLVLA